jgi:UDP-N-acetylmuramyl pentapeptide phosphotransferase/UDP-N-acetylglucosamine-1-phosphate transferase
MNLLLFMLGLIAVLTTDFTFMIRQKKRRETAIISAMVLIAIGLGVLKLMNVESPVKWLHFWLSPIGKMLWSS